MKNAFAYFLLPAGVATSFGGIHMAAGGQLLGWMTIATGLAGVGLAYRMMRGAPSASARETPPAE